MSVDQIGRQKNIWHELENKSTELMEALTKLMSGGV